MNGRRLVGVVVLIAAAALGLGRELQIRRDLAYAAEMGASPSVQSDSALRATVAYHEARARAGAEARWSLRGHGTLGVAGFIAGIAILAAARRRRPG